MRLDGKVAIITGASSGIGRTAALLFAKEGARVAVASDRNVAGGTEVARLIREQGGEAIYVQTDVSRASDCARLVSQTVETFGGVNILFNNAGFSNYGSLLEFSEEDWDRMMDVNVKGAFLMSRAAIPYMLQAKGGSIINTSSVHALRTRGTAAAYAASKAALIGLTNAMAIEFGLDRIRVNSIAPGSVDMFVYPNPAHLAKGQTQDGRWKIVDKEPMGRMGTPEEAAQLVLFLASDESAYISGTFIPVDGALLSTLRIGEDLLKDLEAPTRSR
ncbi:MAG: SDR family oxidoreductase [Chloroflexi bacterium]|nr:SDR family oxidoreductase [Chloroflexota bacterium]